MSVKEQKRRQSWKKKEGHRKREGRGSWSHLKFISVVPLVFRVHSQNTNKVVFKAVYELAFQLLVSSFSFPGSFSFLVTFHSVLNLKKVDVLNISISVYRYMFIFTVGKRWQLQQNLAFTSVFANNH